MFYRDAVHWFEKAAAHGLTSALYNLGLCYEKGNGVTRDKAKAAEFYAKAADQGDEDAMFKLGCWHRDGEAGFAPDAKEARAYLLRAQKAGHKRAAEELETQNDGELTGGDAPQERHSSDDSELPPPRQKKSLLRRLFGGDK